MPKVSIIIPIYNCEEFLAEALESALAQTWPNKEIIVVDDGSTDGGLAVAKRFESDMVKLYSQKNAGAAAARNAGMSKATGDYIQYLDADDLLMPDKIERQLDLLQASPPGCMASCPWSKFSKSEPVKEQCPEQVWRDYDHPVDWLVDSFEGGGMMQTACWLVPRAVAENAGGWDDRLSLHDDGEYFARVLLASRGVRFCGNTHVRYRMVPNSLSNQSTHRLAAESALNVYKSYTRILDVESSERVRHALLMNFVRFIYEYHPEHADLIALAYEQINDLGYARLPAIGGRTFRRIAKVVGFNNALSIRGLLRMGTRR